MEAAEIDAMCLSSGSDLPYLTGYRAPESERVTMLVLDPDGGATLVIPTLEAPRVASTGGVFDLYDWGETDDPIAIIDGLLGNARHVAVGGQTWSRFTLALQSRSGRRSWVDAEPIMSGLRIVKSADEIARLRAAASSVDRVVSELETVRFSGRTEVDVAHEITERTMKAGHDSVEFCIVASGPNAASPHHTPSKRIITHRDAVVVDFGGSLDGYYSDTTRTFVVGEPPDGFREAYTVLRAAQESATAFVEPGRTAAEVDAHARDLIESAGYGDRFIHRLGHGIGLDVHERPYLVEGDDTVLTTGMVFSIEPGIYVPEEWGMRIEDIVAVTDGGSESLNTSDRAYRVVS